MITLLSTFTATDEASAVQMAALLSDMSRGVRSEHRRVRARRPQHDDGVEHDTPVGEGGGEALQRDGGGGVG